MSDFQRVCLVHYHEIGLKGKNRTNFEMRLLKNIEALLSEEPVAAIKRISGRLCVPLRSQVDYKRMCTLADRIARVPGVARVSCGFTCELDLAVMAEAAYKALCEVENATSFKVAARRNHTDFSVSSMDMNCLIGAHLLKAFPNMVVKMKDPDVVVGCEAVQGAAYLYAHSVRGIGGLPVGSSGVVVGLLSSGIDSPVALWRLARRGAVCIGVHFSGRPQTADTSEYVVDDIARVLEQSGCIARVYTIPFGDYQRKIALSCPPALRVILYRRLMFRVAEGIAKQERAGALVTGESLGQVASQTLDNIRATDAVVSMPVFRPLIGTDKIDIISEAQALGSFELSSQDAPDCCTLFMPRNPETHAKLAAVEQAEAAYPYEDWITHIMDEAEVRDYACAAYRRMSKNV